jgi:hypothetical protein
LQRADDYARRYVRAMRGSSAEARERAAELAAKEGGVSVTAHQRRASGDSARAREEVRRAADGGR